MLSGEKLKYVLATLSLSLALMMFSFFISYKFPLKLVSFFALSFAALIISRSIRSVSDLKRITGSQLSFGLISIYSLTGLAGGVAFSLLYRWHLEISLFPGSIHPFVIVAALIGSMEELVFRGFIQDNALRVNGIFSILAGTVSHTGYKCCLFLSPAADSGIDVGLLALWTLGAGLIFGIVKHLTKSILPSLVAHAVFDILVYAEFTHAPWWVW